MARARRAPAGELDEAQWSAQVQGLAELYGWRGYHTHDSRRSQAGFPDWTFVRGPELLFAELKTDKGRVRPEQREWLAELAHVGREVKAELDHLTAEVSYLATGTEERPAYTGPVAIEAHLWRPRDFDAVNERLSRGRHRLEPTYR